MSIVTWMHMNTPKSSKLFRLIAFLHKGGIMCWHYAICNQLFKAMIYLPCCINRLLYLFAWECSCSMRVLHKCVCEFACVCKCCYLLEKAVSSPVSWALQPHLWHRSVEGSSPCDGSTGSRQSYRCPTPAANIHINSTVDHTQIKLNWISDHVQAAGIWGHSGELMKLITSVSAHQM